MRCIVMVTSHLVQPSCQRITKHADKRWNSCQRRGGGTDKGVTAANTESICVTTSVSSGPSRHSSQHAPTEDHELHLNASTPKPHSSTDVTDARDDVQIVATDSPESPTADAQPPKPRAGFGLPIPTTPPASASARTAKSPEYAASSVRVHDSAPSCCSDYASATSNPSKPMPITLWPWSVDSKNGAACTTSNGDDSERETARASVPVPYDELEGRSSASSIVDTSRSNGRVASRFTTVPTITDVGEATAAMDQVDNSVDTSSLILQMVRGRVHIWMKMHNYTNHAYMSTQSVYPFHPHTSSIHMMFEHMVVHTTCKRTFSNWILITFGIYIARM